MMYTYSYMYSNSSSSSIDTGRDICNGRSM